MLKNINITFTYINLYVNIQVRDVSQLNIIYARSYDKTLKNIKKHKEALKRLNEFYSFRISKVIRLIVRPNQNDIEIELIYVSTDHYRDFNESKVK